MEAPRSGQTLADLTGGFDGVLHLWVSDSEGSALLIWPDQLTQPRRMDLPAATIQVDLNRARERTLAVSVNQDGRQVLWLGDRNRLEPVWISDHPLNAVWHEEDPTQLAVTVNEEASTVVTTHRVEPGNVLVEIERFTVGPGRTVEWYSDAGMALASRSGLRVGVWLTTGGNATTYPRHLTQPGGRPIFDICTGVPCRPTVRMYVASEGAFETLEPEVVQVAPDMSATLAFSADGIEVRLFDGRDLVVPISGVNAWSTEWMAFEHEGVVTNGVVTHPLGFLHLETGRVVSVPGPYGEIAGLWLP